MLTVNVQDLTEKTVNEMSVNEVAWIYNGLDVCITADIFEELRNQIETDEPCVKATYETALAKSAPIMEMSLRGTKIDRDKHKEVMSDLKHALLDLDDNFQYMMKGIFGNTVNWRSPTQVKFLFYTMLNIKPIRKRNAKGIYAPSSDRAALEELQKYIIARPFARFILALRDMDKQMSFLRTELDEDNRIRCNYNIAGTKTGRLSSSMSDFGTGTNLQNINRKLRGIFVADPMKYMVNIDLEQADGRNVGAVCHSLFYDSHGPEFASAYLDACESGDLHTQVCKLVWPNLDWPEDDRQCKKFCDSLIAHGQDSYRQLAKKGGHGTNYYGTPRTVAKHLHTTTKIIEGFQRDYFGAFPCIPEWHKSVINQIDNQGKLTTLFGRRRHFFGRRGDASIHRSAIAYEPQSMTGEQIDRGILAVWRKYPEVEVLNQVHDSVLLQVPLMRADKLIPEILTTMAEAATLTLKGDRKFVVPLEAAGGWNWDYKSESNPYGLAKWIGQEGRKAPYKGPKRLRKLLKGPGTL